MPPAERPIDYIPIEYLERTRQSLGKNSFFRFLKKLFGKEKAPAADRREGYDMADYFIKNLLCPEADKSTEKFAKYFIHPLLLRI